MEFRDTCFGYQDRRPGCHGVCEKYLIAKAEHEAKKELIREQKARENDVNDILMRGAQRAAKKKRRYGNGQQDY